jgi:hypothetical protein
MGPSNGHGVPGRSGRWDCPCGQTYRVFAADGEVWMWPKNSANGYRAEPIAENCVCGAPVSRGTVLSGLFGANVVAAVATELRGQDDLSFMH